MVVKLPPLSRKPWGKAPGTGVKIPKIWLLSLIPETKVKVTPGTSMVVKLPPL